jgi:beta-hydroxylase
MFDDTYEHWAANDSDRLRSVLFMDVMKPLPRGLALVNMAIIKIARVFPYVVVPWWRHKRWEKKFYKR